jgi:6,7-dimethyl-8-ribityllumazine synthase
MKIIKGQPVAPGAKIAIVLSEFNTPVITGLLKGAHAALQENGIDVQGVPVVHVPGAFELPLLCQKLAPKYDGIIALGAVIRGETPHFDYVCSEAARGIMNVSLQTDTPVMFGVITTNTAEQAFARSSAAHNKGHDVTVALLKVLNVIGQIS